MKRAKKYIIAAILCISVLLNFSMSSFALTDAQKKAINDKIASYQAENKKLNAEITQLKKEKNQQSAVLNALQKKISNIQSIINTYNAEISRINSVIADNKAKIAEREAEIAQDKLEYKKRIRAIYMSEWDSNLKLFLDADSFSEYLQLKKLTEAVSAKDKKFMEALSEEIAELDAINAENRQLLESQVELKNEVKAQQDELKSQQSEATAIYNEIAKEVKDTSKEISANETEIANLKKQLEAEVSKKGNAAATFINSNTGFMWPVAGYYTISSPFGQRKSGNHSGMDIAGGGIQGRPILAITDGVVYMAQNSWTSSMGKSGYASYGNFCAVDHGIMTIGGVKQRYQAFYAHATSIVVSVGQSVKQGQVLGYVGTTGNSTGYHLHIGIRVANVRPDGSTDEKSWKWVNPYPLLR